MTILYRHYVIPIELFTRDRRKEVEYALEKQHIIFPTNEEFPTFFNIADDNPAVYELSTELPKGFVFFDGTGSCIVISDSTDNWIISDQTIIDELANRANKHNELITGVNHNWIEMLLESAKLAIGHDDFPEPSINYIFLVFIYLNAPID